MTFPTFAAVALLVATAVAHSVLGERYLLMRLFRRPDLPKLFGSADFTRRTLRMAWHATTVAWLGIAAILLALQPGGAPAADVLRIVGATALASAVLSLVVTHGRHLSWLAFLAVGVLCLAAA